jgi:hypothetical protein
LVMPHSTFGHDLNDASVGVVVEGAGVVVAAEVSARVVAATGVGGGVEGALVLGGGGVVVMGVEVFAEDAAVVCAGGAEVVCGGAVCSGERVRQAASHVASRRSSGGVKNLKEVLVPVRRKAAGWSSHEGAHPCCIPRADMSIKPLCHILCSHILSPSSPSFKVLMIERTVTG